MTKPYVNRGPGGLELGKVMGLYWNKGNSSHSHTEECVEQEQNKTVIIAKMGG